ITVCLGKFRVNRQLDRFRCASPKAFEAALFWDSACLCKVARQARLCSKRSTEALPRPEALAIPEMPSIVVLPFQNLSGDPEQEYFSDGIVEEITTALSRFRSLFVISRNSAFTYKGRAADVRQVGRELGVRYLLEGSVRKAANRVRIIGQLIEAASAAHL